MPGVSTASSIESRSDVDGSSWWAFFKHFFSSPTALVVNHVQNRHIPLHYELWIETISDPTILWSRKILLVYLCTQTALICIIIGINEKKDDSILDFFLLFGFIYFCLAVCSMPFASVPIIFFVGHCFFILGKIAIVCGHGENGALNKLQIELMWLIYSFPG